MKINRTKNAARNMMMGFINKIIVLLLPFVVRTAFIYSLGAEYLGLNSLFSSILSVLSVAELGFSSAVVFSMYGPIAKNQQDKICALLNYYRSIYRVIGTVVLAGGIALMPFLPRLINGECPDELNIYILFAIYLFNTVSSYWFMAYKKSVLEAFQRNDYISLNDTITTGLTNIIQLILLIVWKSTYVYYFYVATMLVLTIINNILNARIVGKKFPQLKCEGKVTSKDKREIKKQVSGLMVSRLCFMTRNSFDSIFVSAFISLTMTTIYNNYYFIVNAIVGVMNVITSAMIGGIGNSIAAESKKKNYNDFTVFNFIYMWISIWATVTLFCLYQNFMVLWVGEKLTLPLLVPVLFSIYFYALKMADIRITYTSAAGLWWENRSRAICETIANLILNYLLVHIWGVYGIVLATIIPLILINFGFGAQVLFKHYFTDEKISKYFIDNLGYAVVTIISVIVTFKVTTFIGEYTVANLFIRGIVCCILPNILLWFAYFRTLKFKMAKEWVLTKIKGDTNQKLVLRIYYCIAKKLQFLFKVKVILLTIFRNIMSIRNGGYYEF